LGVGDAVDVGGRRMARRRVLSNTHALLIVGGDLNERRGESIGDAHVKRYPRTVPVRSGTNWKARLKDACCLHKSRKSGQHRRRLL